MYLTSLVVLYLHNFYAQKTDFQLAQECLATGKIQDAIMHYTNAIDKEKSNHIIYFLRGKLYAGIHKYHLALDDFQTTLKLSPTFSDAYIERGKSFLRYSKFEESRSEYKKLLQLDPKHSEAVDELKILNEIISKRDDALHLVETSKCDEAITLIKDLLKTLTMDVELMENLMTCYEKVGDLDSIISTKKLLAKLSPDQTSAAYELGQLLYKLGRFEESLSQAKRCLNLDQDHKECKKIFKKTKKITRYVQDINKRIEEKKWGEVLKLCDTLQKEDTTSKMLKEALLAYRCRAFESEKKTDEAIETCSELLEHQENNIECILSRGRAHLHKENYDDATKDFQRVISIDNSNSDAKEAMKSIDRLKKSTGRKDYYKILGVSKSASKAEVKKAYKKMVLKWHPDKFTDEKEKEKATKVFKDVNDAKEVLSDDEKRNIFDSGRDPLSSEEQQRQEQQHHQSHQGNTFFGGNPFEFFGGGSTFTFHF